MAAPAGGGGRGGPGPSPGDLESVSDLRHVPAIGGLDDHQRGVRFRGRVRSPVPHWRTFNLLRTHWCRRASSRATSRRIARRSSARSEPVRHGSTARAPAGPPLGSQRARRRLDGGDYRGQRLHLAGAYRTRRIRGRFGAAAPPRLRTRDRRTRRTPCDEPGGRAPTPSGGGEGEGGADPGARLEPLPPLRATRCST